MRDDPKNLSVRCDWSKRKQQNESISAVCFDGGIWLEVFFFSVYFVMFGVVDYIVASPMHAQHI